MGENHEIISRNEIHCVDFNKKAQIKILRRIVKVVDNNGPNKENLYITNCVNVNHLPADRKDANPL